MAQKLQQQLKEVGSKLDPLPSTKDAILKLLKQAATCLSELDQSLPSTALESMNPFLNAIIKPELLKHQDKDVKLLVATCICEITRITAPEAPYSDDVLKDVFHLIVGTFSGLSDTSGPSFGRRLVILETLAKYRSCVVMLDLECDDLVNEMFSTFFAVARDDHPESVLSSMQTIMVVVLEESEDVQDDLLSIILSALGRNRSDVTKAARRLAMNVIEHCIGKLETGIKQFLISSMSGDNQSSTSHIDYHEVIYDVYSRTPQILAGVVPYLTGELLADELDTRLKAVKLVGDLFALPASGTSETFQPVFSEFLKRLTDREVGVRMSVLEHVRSCLVSEPSRAEAPQIISALCDRLLDYDENVRKQVVAVICDVACHAPDSIPVETIKLVAERIRDKSLIVKKYTVERLAEIFRVYCGRISGGLINSYDFDWIPGKILRCLYDKDFRLDTIESILCLSLFPKELSIGDEVKSWVRVFSSFDKVEVKALERILDQKQRLQVEMQRYLSLRQIQQDGDAPERQKKILFGFRIMSRSFSESLKAEESFQVLDQLKDTNVWKILTNLLDPKTSISQAYSSRDELLQILGEKHRLYDFLGSLSLKCSYLLFNKEHVKEILVEVALQKSAGSSNHTKSCMDILVMLARFSPLLLGGSEEDLMNFLKDDNEIIKEGTLHVLAKAGGTIREQLSETSSSIDLILEKLCLEGSRRQAKYAVHALAAITKDDGLKSLSVLYKRLVDMLEEETHLPAVLQSLGCIAQTAMPVFETRESEIEEFIKNNILKRNNKAEDNSKECWDDRSEVCLLKIFGIKTLVKSYLPVKDANLRPDIDGLLALLKNLLSFGEISEEIESSSVDKAHLRLAAAKAVLRLSKNWDNKIPLDVFYLTIRLSEASFPQARKILLSKVYQYIKDRVLDAKYACAFLFSITEANPFLCEEEKQNLADIIQMFQQAKARQVSLQSGTDSSPTYPEYILPYLVHALAHHSCPDIDECKDVKAFEVIYRQLYLVVSMLVHKDEDAKSEDSANREKEILSAISSIFQGILCSEDIVDANKSKNSHAICELGLSITKRLHKVDDLQVPIQSVSLPPMLYKPYEKEGGDDSVAKKGQTWLADESVLSHFESLKLEIEETIQADIGEDEAFKDSDGDGNELPIGKIIKRIKSQSTKDGKAKKEKSLSGKNKTPENDINILDVVREINFDSLGTSNKFESSNGHKHSPRKKAKVGQEDQKGKKRKDVDTESVQVPKRRRSSSTRTKSSRSEQETRDSLFQSAKLDEADLRDLEDKGNTKSNSSSFRKKRSSSSRRDDKGSDSDGDAKAYATDDDSLEKSDMLMETDDVKANSKKSASGSNKKQKRKSVAGLGKCSTKKSGINIEDLIGYKIKVWWPMDKKFYQGTVKTYDPLQRKHVVLYDDGDVEVLRLDRERWELVDKSRKPVKKSSSSKPTPRSSGKKNKDSGGSRQNKASSPLVKGKRTPKKNLKRTPKRASISDLSDSDHKESSDESEAKFTAVSKISDSDSDIPERTETLDGNQTYKEESNKEVESLSHGDSENTKESPNLNEESDEVKSDPDEKVEDMDDIPKDEEEKEDSKDDDEEKAADESNEEKSADESSEEKAAGESSEEKAAEESSEEKAADESSEEEADEEIKSEPKSNIKGKTAESQFTGWKKSSKRSSLPSTVADAEISDDEPLSKWTQQVGKSKSKRAP